MDLSRISPAVVIPIAQFYPDTEIADSRDLKSVGQPSVASAPGIIVESALAATATASAAKPLLIISLRAEYQHNQR